MRESMKVVMADALVGNDYSLLLCSHLHRLGVEVALIVVRDRAAPFPVSFPLWRWAPSKESKDRVIRKSLDYLKYLLKLSQFALYRRVDILHFQFLRRERPETILLILLGFLRVRWVMTVHNLVPHEGSLVDWILKALAYRQAALLMVHSRWMARELHCRFHIPYAKIRVVPHGDFRSYHPTEPIDQQEARERLGLPTEGPVALFFGYIRKYKGLDLLLDAFEMAYRSNPLLRLVIAGQCQTPALEKRYREKIQAMTASRRVLFRPQFVPWQEVALYLLAADLIVLPYARIDHSGILHLAYSFGKPVLATDVGDFREMIAEDRTGWVVSSGDPKALASALLDALGDRKRLQALGARARELSHKKYSWIASARCTLQAYDELLTCSRSI